MSQEMAKIVFYIVFSALFSFSLQDSACNSGILSKCDCVRKTDPLEKIPLINIDCSRLNLVELPSNNILPLYTGHLDLSHNNITSLNDSILSSSTLNYLDLSYNKINSIPNKFFQNLTQLSHLNLGHNKLTTLTIDVFYGLANLKILNLRSNGITNISEQLFFGLPKLKELILSNNKLGDYLEQKKLSNYLPKSIRSLYLDHLQLKNISRQLFEDIPHLKRLSIAYNPFSELPYLPLSNLEYLDISGTNISNITTKGLMFPYLKVLKMNRLPHITKIQDYTFFNLHKLEELYIEHCIRLEEMDPISFGYLQDKESPNHLSLRKISVAYSGLKFLPDAFQFIFQNLEEIHLRGNFWDCDCKLIWFTHLKKNVKDIDEIRCFSPESQVNKTIHSMKDEEFSCFQSKKMTTTPPGAPMQRWLFPVIGVLAIIIFIMIAILIYMGPYGQNIYKMEGKMIGPDSPYSPVSIYPNQAENFKI